MIVFCRILTSLSTGLLLAGQGQIGNVCTFYAGSYSYVPVYLLQRFWLVCGKAGFQVLTLGALVYLPLGKLQIATLENAASTQKSECFSTETTVYHRFRSVVRSFILGGKQRAPENVR